MLRLIRQTLREVKVNGTPVYMARDGGAVLEDLCRNSGVLKQTRRSVDETYEWESVLWLQFFAAAHIARKPGIDVMHTRRCIADLTCLTNGPGKLCQALAITRAALDGWDLTQGQRLWLAAPVAARPLGAIAVGRPRLIFS